MRPSAHSLCSFTLNMNERFVDSCTMTFTSPAAPAGRVGWRPHLPAQCAHQLARSRSTASGRQSGHALALLPSHTYRCSPSGIHAGRAHYAHVPDPAYHSSKSSDLAFACNSSSSPGWVLANQMTKLPQHLLTKTIISVSVDESSRHIGYADMQLASFAHRIVRKCA